MTGESRRGIGWMWSVEEWDSCLNNGTCGHPEMSVSVSHLILSKRDSMCSGSTASLMSLMVIIVSYHQLETEGRSRLGGVVAMLFKQVYSFSIFPVKINSSSGFGLINRHYINYHLPLFTTLYLGYFLYNILH